VKKAAMVLKDAEGAAKQVEESMRLLTLMKPGLGDQGAGRHDAGTEGSTHE
jgi:hypothetical protein